MRLGIFGGTFDPPHLGHLVLAAEAADQLGLDRVLWVITPDPPHKQAQLIRPVEVRLALLQAALRGLPGFEISLVDVERPGPQYAADTLGLLAQQHPGDELVYLIGGDSLRDLPGWYEPQRLLRQTALLGVMRRPGAALDLGQLERQLPGLKHKLRFIDSPQMDIASRDLRERIRSRRHYRYFVPQAVWELIEANSYYR